MTACLTDDEVAALVEGEASASVVERAEGHATGCEACRGVLALVGRVRALDEAATVPDRGGELEFEPGARLRRYEIIGELGRGAMGVVFEARDPELERRVAVKVLQLEDEGRLARISREAQAVAALSHPNVVQVFDAGLEDGRAFIVMELVEGRTLEAWLEEKERSWRRIVDVFEAAGRGLAAAHAAGIVHRDFKPANVLVGAGGVVKVVDFGLARPLGESSDGAETDEPADLTLTVPGTAIGTPLFMAPEQHRGDRVGAQADVYAFGVALYQALYGRPPFVASSVTALLAAKMQDEPVRPDGTTVPAPVHEAVRTSLAPEPEDRWTSMRAFLAALRRARKGRRRGALLIGVVAAGVALASVAVEGSWAGRDDAPVGDAMLVNVDRALARAAIGEGRAALAIDANAHALARLQEGLDRAEVVGDDVLRLDAALEVMEAHSALEQHDTALEVGKLARALAERTNAGPDRIVALLSAEAMAFPIERRPERLKRLEEALAICREHPGELEAELASVLTQLANAMPRADAARAHALILEALEIRERLGGPDDTATLSAEIVMAQVESLRGGPDACVQRAANVYGRAKRALTRGRAARTVAVCMTDRGDPRSAVPWADRALEEAAVTHSRASVQYAERLEFKAALLSRSHQFAAAAETNQQAVAILEARSKRPNIGVARAYRNLSTTLQKLGDPKRSHLYARKALEEAEALGDATLVRNVRLVVAEALVNLGRHEEALALLTAVAGEPPYDDDGLVARALIAVSTLQTGDPEAGLRIAEETVALMSGDAQQALRNWIEKHR